MKKKAILMLSMVLTAAFVLAGCSGNKLDGTETVATLDDTTNMQLGELSLMLRYEQAQMETYYGSMFGSGVFQQDMGDGTIYGEMARDSLLESFEEMYILEAEAANYGIELTEEEKTAIAEAADKFMEDNTSQAKKAMGVSRENVERVLSLMTIQTKMEDTLTADVDTEVTDEEAAQKRISYIYASNQTTAEDGSSAEMNDAEKAEVQKKLQEILDAVKAGGDFAEEAEARELTASEATYGAESTSPVEEVRTAADELADGECSTIIETDSGYYIVQMVSTFDREATDSRKEAIVQERKNALYDEKYAELAEAHSFTVNDETAAKLTFERTYTLKTEE